MPPLYALGTEPVLAALATAFLLLFVPEPDVAAAAHAPDVTAARPSRSRPQPLAAGPLGVEATAGLLEALGQGPPGVTRHGSDPLPGGTGRVHLGHRRALARLGLAAARDRVGRQRVAEPLGERLRRRGGRLGGQQPLDPLAQLLESLAVRLRVELRPAEGERGGR